MATARDTAKAVQRAAGPIKVGQVSPERDRDIKIRGKATRRVSSVAFAPAAVVSRGQVVFVPTAVVSRGQVRTVRRGLTGSARDVRTTVSQTRFDPNLSPEQIASSIDFGTGGSARGRKEVFIRELKEKRAQEANRKAEAAAAIKKAEQERKQSISQQERGRVLRDTGDGKSQRQQIREGINVPRTREEAKRELSLAAGPERVSEAQQISRTPIKVTGTRTSQSFRSRLATFGASSAISVIKNEGPREIVARGFKPERKKGLEQIRAFETRPETKEAKQLRQKSQRAELLSKELEKQAEEITREQKRTEKELTGLQSASFSEETLASSGFKQRKVGTSAEGGDIVEITSPKLEAQTKRFESGAKELETLTGDIKTLSADFSQVTGQGKITKVKGIGSPKRPGPLFKETLIAGAKAGTVGVVGDAVELTGTRQEQKAFVTRTASEVSKIPSSFKTNPFLTATGVGAAVLTGAAITGGVSGGARVGRAGVRAASRASKVKPTSIVTESVSKELIKGPTGTKSQVNIIGVAEQGSKQFRFKFSGFADSGKVKTEVVTPKVLRKTDNLISITPDTSRAGLVIDFPAGKRIVTKQGVPLEILGRGKKAETGSLINLIGEVEGRPGRIQLRSLQLSSKIERDTFGRPQKDLFGSVGFATTEVTTPRRFRGPKITKEESFTAGLAKRVRSTPETDFFSLFGSSRKSKGVIPKPGTTRQVGLLQVRKLLDETGAENISGLGQKTKTKPKTPAQEVPLQQIQESLTKVIPKQREGGFIPKFVEELRTPTTKAKPKTRKATSQIPKERQLGTTRTTTRQRRTSLINVGSKLGIAGGLKSAVSPRLGLAARQRISTRSRQSFKTGLRTSSLTSTDVATRVLQRPRTSSLTRQKSLLEGTPFSGPGFGVFRTPPLVPFGLPKGGGVGRGKKGSKTGAQELGFAPSLVAVEFGIKAKRSQIKTRGLSGFEIRPIALT